MLRTKRPTELELELHSPGFKPVSKPPSPTALQLALPPGWAARRAVKAAVEMCALPFTGVDHGQEWLLCRTPKALVG